MHILFKIIYIYCKYFDIVWNISNHVQSQWKWTCQLISWGWVSLKWMLDTWYIKRSLKCDTTDDMIWWWLHVRPQMKQKFPLKLNDCGNCNNPWRTMTWKEVMESEIWRKLGKLRHVRSYEILKCEPSVTPQQEVWRNLCNGGAFPRNIGSKTHTRIQKNKKTNVVRKKKGREVFVTSLGYVKKKNDNRGSGCECLMSRGLTSFAQFHQWL